MYDNNIAMSCEISSLPKYQKRKSPPIPANDCELGVIETGNDGELWQIVTAGKSQRWVKCGTGSTNCGNVIKVSTKKVKPTKSVKSKKSSSDKEQHFAIKGKVTLRKVDESREKLPDNKTFYKYMTKNKHFVKELVEDIAGYQMIYDMIYNINLDQNLNLSFNITNYKDGNNSDYRKRYHSEFMSANQIKKDLVSSIDTFGDGCYGSSPPSECLYPDSSGGVLAEISIKNLTVTKVNNPNSKSVKSNSSIKTKKVSKKNIEKKECPSGKVLSPKGRCVKDRSKPKKSPKKSTDKKECPPGKVLSPKGRCVKDRSNSKKSTGKKECPPGKVLSPKGRCVIDRSNPKKSTGKKECPPGKVISPKGRCVKDRSKSTKSSKKLTKKKECPPGKILSPKGRCVKDRSLPTNNITNNNRYIITKKTKNSKKSYDYDDEWALEEDRYVEGIPTKSQMNKRRKYIDDIYKYQNQLVKLGANEDDAPPPESWRDPPQYCYNTQLEGMVSVMKDTLNDFKHSLKNKKNTQVKNSVKNPQVTNDYGSCVSPEFRLNSDLPRLPKKYLNRPGPPYPANDCSQGDIKLGNDGNLYQNLLVNARNGKTLKWVKCGRAGTQC